MARLIPKRRLTSNSFRFAGCVRPRALLIALASAAAITASVQPTAHAAPSDLDPTFGAGGRLTTAIGADDDELVGVAVQPDGKIVAAGAVVAGDGWFDFAVARYDTTGALDSSFDGDGIATTAIGANQDVATALALQPDGKIVVGGYTISAGLREFSLIRLNADGSLDSTFDGNGKLIASIGAGDDRLHALALQPDGKIVAAGYGGGGVDDDIAVARFDPDGSFDATFSADGKVMTMVRPGNDYANAIAIQADGKIVVAGSNRDLVDHDVALVRYQSNGSLDPAFGGDGTVLTTMGGFDDEAHAIAIRSDGKIVIGGRAPVAGFSRDWMLARYNSDGSLDPSLDGDGTVITRIGLGGNEIKDLALLPDGDVLAAGWTYNGADSDLTMTRFNPDGSFDSAFDADGVAVNGVAQFDDTAEAMAIQPDGRVVAGGQLDNGSNLDFTLARFDGESSAPPAVSDPGPSATITSPRRRRTRSRSLKALRGTAGPVGQVAKVEIALRRIDRKLLKRGRCAWLKNARAEFKSIRDSKRKCATPRFLKARGRESWRFKLKRHLRPGRYKLFVRVTLADGRRHTSYSVAQGNLLTFRAT